MIRHGRGDPAPAPPPRRRETPPGAGLRQSGSAYLPPGQTSCEAGVHRAGFSAPAKHRTRTSFAEVDAVLGSHRTLIRIGTAGTAQIASPRPVQGRLQTSTVFWSDQKRQCSAGFLSAKPQVNRPRAARTPCGFRITLPNSFKLLLAAHPELFTRRMPRRHSRAPPPRQPMPRGNVGRRTPDLGRVP